MFAEILSSIYVIRSFVFADCGRGHCSASKPEPRGRRSRTDSSDANSDSSFEIRCTVAFRSAIKIPKTCFISCQMTNSKIVAGEKHVFTNEWPTSTLGAYPRVSSLYGFINYLNVIQ